MSNLFIIMIMGGGIFGLFILIWYMSVYRVKDSGSYFDARRIDWEVINASDIQHYLSLGRKLEAIKAYRDYTNVGLREAKDTIEYVMNVIENPKSDKRAYSQENGIDWTAINHPDVQDAISLGNKIEAIKHYRTHTKVGLKEAKDAIDYAFDHPEEAERKKRSPVNNLSDGGVRDLVEEGRIEEAIEIYRTFTGMDEYSARAAVERIRGEL